MKLWLTSWQLSQTRWNSASARRKMLIKEPCPAHPTNYRKFSVGQQWLVDTTSLHTCTHYTMCNVWRFWVFDSSCSLHFYHFFSIHPHQNDMDIFLISNFFVVFFCARFVFVRSIGMYLCNVQFVWAKFVVFVAAELPTMKVAHWLSDDLNNYPPRNILRNVCLWVMTDNWCLISAVLVQVWAVGDTERVFFCSRRGLSLYGRQNSKI